MAFDPTRWVLLCLTAPQYEADTGPGPKPGKPYEHRDGSSERERNPEWPTSHDMTRSHV